MHEISELCFGKEVLPKEVLQWIAKENLWNLWVPKSHGGLEASLIEGLETLRSLAKLDGSLGWTVTLCSGANFFVGNLGEDVANELFNEYERPVFGGSGGVFGTADTVGDGYVINGTWKYATGAPYLTHFTLNAKIRQDGADVLMDDGTPMVRSFLLRREQVEMIQDWNTMGLRATATNSFEVNSQWVDGKYSFVYNQFYQPQPIFKVPFGVFADLTLWINYIGMAERFLEEAKLIVADKDILIDLQKMMWDGTNECMGDAKCIHSMVMEAQYIPEPYIKKIHQKALHSVRSLTNEIIQVFPILGIRASTLDHSLNQAFRDYFTATQHHIFSPLGRRNQS
ncbi:acyl-CoA dehydrogenase [Flagellimonas okinawensis]|uniref:Acyl-CoA dehydrogenase n=1 Tax=Flagellimonas okinawensis TaxID=3031324 RepID=A0ABT5XRS5_9FLAO|nr:acyl-CoA dehydrogenase [[Muricauda] okinawensis]MDF0708600.1 acyl-CoA dehydrogenase [[Muricauda] okinawensis]